MLRVLTYHRIADPATTPHLHPSLASAAPDVFEAHVRFVAKHYRPVSLQDVQRAAHGETALPSRAVLLTFDDAYLDFQSTAWPILKRHAVPAALFVPTAYPDRPDRGFWWDRLYRAFRATPEREIRSRDLGALPCATPDERQTSLLRVQVHVKSLPWTRAMQEVEEVLSALHAPAFGEPVVLSWQALRDLAADGVAIAPHSRTHPLFTRLRPDEAREEVQGCMDDLRREMGDAIPVFAYPSGAHDDASVEVLRACGMQLAFTQVDGHDDLRKADRLRLHRTNITRRTTPFVLRLRLQTWFTAVDRWRHRERPATAAAAGSGHA